MEQHLKRVVNKFRRIKIMDETYVQVKDNKGKALASLILGAVSVVAWLIPLFGLPVTIVGLVMGILGRNSTRKSMAIIGIVLCSLFLIVTLINAIIGAIAAVSMINSLQ
jgi:MFS family permease